MQLTEFCPAPNGWEHLTYHPLSEVVNFGVGIDVDALAGHMKDYGYDDDEGIVLYRNQILDGRHKHKAAIIAEVVPTFKRFVGKSAEAYVAKKAFRQHLNTSQRAMLAATISTKPTDKSALMPDDPPKTISQAAESMNVSERSVKNAKKVVEQGTEELKNAVLNGTVKVTDAAKIVDEKPSVQRKAVEDVKNGKAKTAKAATEPKKPKSGKPIFDDRQVMDMIGKLARLFDSRAHAYGKGPKHQACIVALDKVLAAFHQWQIS